MNRALAAARKGPRDVSEEAGASKSKMGVWVALLVLLVGGLAAGAWFMLGAKKGQEGDGTTSEVKTAMKLINGKLVRVPVKDTKSVDSGPAPKDVLKVQAPPEKPPPSRKPKRTPRKREYAISAIEGKGADTMIAGKGNGQNYETTNYGNKPSIQVRSVSKEQLSLARKTYIRIDFSYLPRTSAITDARLELYISRKLMNRASNEYRLNLWGIKDLPRSRLWVEGTGGKNAGLSGMMTWLNAIANDPTSGAKLAAPARVLVQIEVPAFALKRYPYRISQCGLRQT